MSSVAWKWTGQVPSEAGISIMLNVEDCPHHWAWEGGGYNGDLSCAYHHKTGDQDMVLCHAKTASLLQSWQKRGWRRKWLLGFYQSLEGGLSLYGKGGAMSLGSPWEWSCLLFVTHLAFVPPWVAGMIPFCRVDLFKLYLREIPAEAAINIFLL